MLDYNELMNFFEVFNTLRDEYVKSDDCRKVYMLASLAQVAVEVIKCGKIPNSFRISHLAPYDCNLLTKPVKELFKRLDIKIILSSRVTCSTSTSAICYVDCMLK